jgi:AraC family transcriptional regulator
MKQPSRPPYPTYAQLIRPDYDHADVVACVIRQLRARPCAPFSLDAMANVAALSPSHFSRVFRRITGIAPGAFQAALRMESAKQLLLTTDLSVTEICFEVGYTSLGTFTSRFTRLVGLPPSTLRRMALEVSLPRFCLKAGADTQWLSTVRIATLRGIVRISRLAHGTAGRLIFVGLFPKPLPQGRPIACSVVTSPGPFAIGPIPDGRYYLLSTALPYLEDLRLYATTAIEPLVAIGDRPIRVRQGVVRGPGTIELRQPRLTDPPVVAALPFLLAYSLATRSHVRYEALA